MLNLSQVYTSDWCNLCPLASFGQSVARKHATFLRWHSVAIIDVNGVFSQHCILHSVCNLIKSRTIELAVVAIDCLSTSPTPHASNTLRSGPALPLLWEFLHSEPIIQFKPESSRIHFFTGIQISAFSDLIQCFCSSRQSMADCLP